MFGVAIASTGESERPARTTAGCPMTYPVFEHTTPHIEVACPKGLSMGSATFCRASIANDSLHVYSFRNDDLQCLLDVKSYDEGDFDLKAH